MANYIVSVLGYSKGKYYKLVSKPTTKQNKNPMYYLLWGDLHAGQLHYCTYSFFVIGASSSHNSQEVATISSPAHIIGRCLIPPPHVFVHFPQSPKRHLYWEGHGFVWHSFQANGGSSTQTKKKKWICRMVRTARSLFQTNYSLPLTVQLPRAQSFKGWTMQSSGKAQSN